MRDRPHFEQGALTDWLGKHTSAVWRTADGSNVKSRLVLQLSACYYDHGPAAYEVAHIRKHPLSCQYFGCWPRLPKCGAAASRQLSGVDRPRRERMRADLHVTPFGRISQRNFSYQAEQAMSPFDSRL
jgi:hypothetical protein